MDLVVGPFFLLVVAFQMLINIYFFPLQDYIDSIVWITGYGIKFFCSLPSALILGPFFEQLYCISDVSNIKTSTANLELYFC